MRPEAPGASPEAKAGVARPQPTPLPEERELTKAVPGEAQEESLLRRQSSRIKPNQTKSNRLEANAEGLMIKDESRKNQAMPQPDSQTQSGPVKPAGAAWAGGFYNRERRRSSCGCATFGPSRRYILFGRESSRIKPDQAKSKQIKPNQTKSNRRGWECSVASGQWMVAKEGGGISPGQTESNRVKPAGGGVD